MEIYTIGHSNYQLEKFLEMLNKYKINAVVDIRGVPYSKYNTQYNKESLSKTLKEFGFIYLYMGLEFAAQRQNKVLYTWEGYADFEKVVKEEIFIKGIERLVNGMTKGYRIAILGAKQEPINCHRAILVGRFLRDKGIDVKHIEDNLTTSSQEEIEERLLERYFPLVEQLTIESITEVDKSKEENIMEAYRKANRDIGLRLEGQNVTDY